MLDDAITMSVLEVVFDSYPQQATLEIIEQFCRLATNEVRRREEEDRSLEFERLTADIYTLPVEDVLTGAPMRIRRIFDCDAVTYFAVQSFGVGETILVPWSSTSLTLESTVAERHYRVAVDDGLTGFAATRHDILLIRNMDDDEERLHHGMEFVHPKQIWKRKIYEDGPGLIRSFFALPLYASGNLVGLIRGHRNVRTKNVPLTDTDGGRLRLVKLLLEGALERSKMGGTDNCMASNA